MPPALLIIKVNLLFTNLCLGNIFLLLYNINKKMFLWRQVMNWARIVANIRNQVWNVILSENRPNNVLENCCVQTVQYVGTALDHRRYSNVLANMPLYCPLVYESVYLPLCRVAYTPFHIQGTIYWVGNSIFWLVRLMAKWNIILILWV